MSIYKKLQAIQKELFVPKGNRNDFGKYNYRSCEDILKAVKPIAENYGCVVVLDNKMVEIGQRVYVEATARLVDIEDDTSVEVTAQAREEETKKGMDGSQITGSASSYARKYALAGLFAIDNEKDSDATNKHEDDSKERAQLMKEINVKLSEIDNANEVFEEIKKKHNITSLSTSSPETLKKILEEL